MCGSSALVAQSGSDDECVRESTYEEAAALCSELGSRLCSVSELGDGQGNPEPCGYDSPFAWTWAAPDDGVAKCTNGSLGVGGRAGEWFSFVSATVNIIYEVRLVMDSQGLTDTTSFSLSIDSEVFDGAGERVVSTAGLFERPGQIMRRWNISSRLGAQHYIRVKSTARHAMTVVAVPGYTAAEYELPPTTTEIWTVLPIATDASARAVQLQFGFKFFGKRYTRLWIAERSGFVTFEGEDIHGQQQSAGPRTAAVVCDGAFDFGKNESEVAMLSTANALQLRWRTPLFDSTVLSDVSLTLRSDGSLSMRWAELNLEGGGSLQHKLVIWLAHSAALNRSTDGIYVPDERHRTGDHFATVQNGQPDAVRREAMGFSRYFSSVAAAVTHYRPNATNGSAVGTFSPNAAPQWHGDGIARSSMWMHQNCLRHSHGCVITMRFVLAQRRFLSAECFPMTGNRCWTISWPQSCRPPLELQTATITGSLPSKLTGQNTKLP